MSQSRAPFGRRGLPAGGRCGIEAVMSETRRIEVNLGPRSYPVVIGAGLLGGLGAILRKEGLKQTGAFLITDPHVAGHYFEKVRASLADALYGAGDGVLVRTGDISEIYVLRASPDPREFGAVTAWHLDARNAANLTLATRFELRPDDIIFVAEQPVTRWNRVIQQITPSLLTTSMVAAIN